jgi:3-hydroxybutyryl-CoA dehydrogenase
VVATVFMNLLTKLQEAPVLVVGAGIMGAGIAQVAAQAGHRVFLFDVREGAAVAAKAGIDKALGALVTKGRLTSDEARAVQARIEPVTALEAAAGAGLALEAIVEQADAKRSLFSQLEALLAPEAVLASNTSSIGITSMSRGLQKPERLVGMHFFNPVPLMKLVEVVSGLHTDAAVAEAIFGLARAWGKQAVHAKSSPGFIVNRIARPFYAEALALLQEQATTPPQLDACVRAGGFRMGPCELMDLIGHDTNFAVTQSVYEANFFDKRYVPSGVQREMVEAGWLGRKSGRGFYRYPLVAGAPPVLAQAAEWPASREVVVLGQGPLADALAQAATVAMSAQGWGPARESASEPGLRLDGGLLLQTDGRCAAERAWSLGTTDVALLDWVPQLPAAQGQALAYALNSGASAAFAQSVPQCLRALGFTPIAMADTPGLVMARTLAMLINEAADAVQQGVCSEAGADAAMKLGVNYPHGPFEWLAQWGVRPVLAVLDALDAHYRGERYRASPWLRERGWTAQRPRASH